MRQTRAGIYGLAWLCLALAGCVAPGVGGSARSAPMLDGALKVGLAKGYCIDRTVGREGNDMAVVLLGRCRDDATAIPAVISIAAGQDGSAHVLDEGGQAMAAFFRSTQGRKTLSGNGKASGVEVLAALGVGDGFVLHLNDSNLGEYWRGILPISGRMVTVTATGTQASPLKSEDGRQILDAAMNAMRAANPPPPTRAQPVVPGAAAAPGIEAPVAG
ncbi:MAG: hypothetical protein RIR95_1232 [Pseudomonadota bacterium]